MQLTRLSELVVVFIHHMRSLVNVKFESHYLREGINSLTETITVEAKTCIIKDRKVQ